MNYMKIEIALNLKKTHSFLTICSFVLLLSCAQANNKRTYLPKNNFETTTIEVSVSNGDGLAILLAKDGTINRIGSGISDTTDKSFFMGISKETVFDSLMETVSDDLLSYAQKESPQCDTTKQNLRVKISFSENDSETEIDYCVNGTADDLPKPIKDYITDAVKITDPWYKAQKNLTDKK
jgi:hypothetical protein